MKEGNDALQPAATQLQKCQLQSDNNEEEEQEEMEEQQELE